MNEEQQEQEEVKLSELVSLACKAIYLKATIELKWLRLSVIMLIDHLIETLRGK
jgi:hypothetical protein